MLLDGLQPPIKFYPCKVRELYETLENADAEILRSAVGNLESWGAKTLSNALHERGISISDLSITRHRKNLCSCGKFNDA
jgi:hypothetical protein